MVFLVKGKQIRLRASRCIFIYSYPIRKKLLSIKSEHSWKEFLSHDTYRLLSTMYHPIRVMFAFKHVPVADTFKGSIK